MNNYDRVREELHDDPDDISMHMRRLLTKKFAGWFPALYKAFGLKEAQSDSKTLTLEDCTRIWANDSEALQSIGITCPEDMLQVVADGSLEGGLSLDEIVRLLLPHVTHSPSFYRWPNCPSLCSQSAPHPAPALRMRSLLAKRRAMMVLMASRKRRVYPSCSTRSVPCCRAALMRPPHAIHALAAGAGAHAGHRQGAVQGTQLAQRRLLNGASSCATQVDFGL